MAEKRNDLLPFTISFISFSSNTKICTVFAIYMANRGKSDDTPHSSQNFQYVTKQYARKVRNIHIPCHIYDTHTFALVEKINEQSVSRETSYLINIIYGISRNSTNA